MEISNLKDITQLKPLELNAIKLDDKHTVLTPEILERFSQKTNK